MKRLALLFAAIVVAGGCATIFSGSTDVVAVDSNPQGATVYLDGLVIGKTPCQAVVSRSWGAGLFVLKYEDREVERWIERGMDPWCLANILPFCSILGCVIDLATGNCRKATEPSIIVWLHKEPPPPEEPKKKEESDWDPWRPGRPYQDIP